MTVSTLDQIAVETGTFNPTFTFDTPGTLSVSYTTQDGFYARINDLVRVEIDIAGNLTKGTASGTFYIAGLPFSNALLGNSLNPSVMSSRISYGTGRTWITGDIAISDNRIRLSVQGSGVVGGNVTDTMVTDGNIGIRLSGWYTKQ